MPRYILEFQEGYDLRPDPSFYSFNVKDDQEALSMAEHVLGISGIMTKEAFNSHGGKALKRKDPNRDYNDWPQVFPPLPKKISVFVQAPEWNPKVRRDWTKFRKWIEAIGGVWSEGISIGMHKVSFVPIEEDSSQRITCLKEGPDSECEPNKKLPGYCEGCGG